MIPVAKWPGAILNPHVVVSNRNWCHILYPCGDYQEIQSDFFEMHHDAFLPCIAIGVVCAPWNDFNATTAVIS